MSRARRPEICERTNENLEKTEYDRHARLCDMADTPNCY